MTELRDPMAAIACERLEPYQLHCEGSDGAPEFACVRVAHVEARSGLTEMTCDNHGHEFKIVVPWTCPEAKRVAVGAELRLFGGELEELHGVTADGFVLFWRTKAMVEQRRRRRGEDADALRARQDHAFRTKALAEDVELAPFMQERLDELRERAERDYVRHREMPERMAMLLAQRMWNSYEASDCELAIADATDAQIISETKELIAGHEDYPYIVHKAIGYLRMLERVENGGDYPELPQEEL